MKDGYIKSAAAAPRIKVADCSYNAEQVIRLMRDADAHGARLAVFPELCLTGCTCGDLFLQSTLHRAAEAALYNIIKASASLSLIAVIGLPVSDGIRLYNCAAVVYAGKLLAITAKSNISRNDLRHFSPAPVSGQIHICGADVPFGSGLIFRCADMPEFSFSTDENTGAAIVICPAAHPELIGTSAKLRMRLCSRSDELTCGYIYAGAGLGESTTDAVYSGRRLIIENGDMLAESEPFTEGLTISEIDTAFIASERIRAGAPDCRAAHTVTFEMDKRTVELTRAIRALPFIPSDPVELRERCALTLEIQAQGLAQRIRHTNAKGVVIGVSGGLDSTLAMLVAARAMDILSRPRAGITAVTLPCFGTTSRTRSNAEILSSCIGANFTSVDIRTAVEQHFRDISHDPSVTDVTYENSQARERTQVLMDIANKTGALVIGTGDLSELALGWATYNGDHMSMYGVNGSVPKTFIRHIVNYAADISDDPEYAAVLRDILDTPVSPELLPANGDDIAQRTEELVGPYELHDFFLYNAVRLGFPPEKILRLARRAFDGIYSEETILKWLRSFYRRFFAQQFKRSCLPDGPAVGSLILSPRGGYAMPSDAIASEWLAKLDM